MSEKTNEYKHTETIHHQSHSQRKERGKVEFTWAGHSRAWRQVLFVCYYGSFSEEP